MLSIEFRSGQNNSINCCSTTWWGMSFTTRNSIDSWLQQRKVVIYLVSSWQFLILIIVLTTTMYAALYSCNKCFNSEFLFSSCHSTCQINALFCKGYRSGNTSNTCPVQWVVRRMLQNLEAPINLITHYLQNQVLLQCCWHDNVFCKLRFYKKTVCKYKTNKLNI